MNHMTYQVALARQSDLLRLAAGHGSTKGLSADQSPHLATRRKRLRSRLLGLGFAGQS